MRENFQRILLVKLTECPARAGCLPSVARRGAPERQVAIRCGVSTGRMGREAALRAEWSVRDAEGRMLLWRQTSLREAVDVSGLRRLVAAEPVVAALAAEIVQGWHRSGRERGRRTARPVRLGIEGR